MNDSNTTGVMTNNYQKYKTENTNMIAFLMEKEIGYASAYFLPGLVIIFSIEKSFYSETCLEIIVKK